MRHFNVGRTWTFLRGYIYNVLLRILSATCIKWTLHASDNGKRFHFTYSAHVYVMSVNLHVEEFILKKKVSAGLSPFLLSMREGLKGARQETIVMIHTLSCL